MRRSFIILLLLFIISQNFCSGQLKRQIDSLSTLYNQLTSDSERVVTLGKLADLYYTYKLSNQGDSILHHQLFVADLSNNRNLILLALFGDAITNITTSTNSATYDKIVQYIQRGINYARSIYSYEYMALGYSRMASVLRKRGQYDNALNNAYIALGFLPNIESDSIKSVLYIELGDTYLDKGDAVSACTNYNTAFDFAFKIKSVYLESTVYHCFSEMYKKLGQFEMAKNELKKSLALNKDNNNVAGMVRDYYDLARLTDEKFYIDQSLKLSDSLNLYNYLFKSKGLMLAYLEVIEKNSEKAITYLESDPDLKQSYLNIGEEYYSRIKGQIYLYSGKADSALSYFKRAESEYLKKYDQKLVQFLFLEIADCYRLLKDIPNAITYNMKALELSKKMNDATSIASTSGKLARLYEEQGDYRLAFVFSKQSIQYKDSLRNLSKEMDIALLGVERENRKHDELRREEERRVINKRNIQYMAITIAIGVVFIILLIIGTFPISKLTIKLLGYIFFISVFEFIVLIIDNFLHKITHGEPLKIWLIKIFLIALLVPIQHFLEHGLIKFLESKKLLAVTKFSFRKWRLRTRKPAISNPTDFEENTAVL